MIPIQAHLQDEKKECTFEDVDAALQKAVSICSKEEAWKAEWTHVAQTFHTRMKFLHTREQLEEYPEAWGVLKCGSYLAGVVRVFGMHAGRNAGVVLNFWWRASLPSLANWVKAEYRVKDDRRTTVKRILGAFGQPGGLLWIDDHTKSIFFKTLRRAGKYVEAKGRGDVERFYWEQMQNAGLASASQDVELDPMLHLAAIEEKKLVFSQLDFLPPKSIIPGSDVPTLLGEVIAKGLYDPFFKTVRNMVPENLGVKAGPPKTPARIRVKAEEYKKNYDRNNEETKAKNYRGSFMKAFNVEPKAVNDFAFQIVDLARVSVTFKKPAELITFVNTVNDSSLFEILAVKNLFREEVQVKPSGYRDLKLLVKFSCSTSKFQRLFKQGNFPEKMSFICEIQCLLEKWIKNKIHTSLSYKLLRAGNINDCLLDFRKYIIKEIDEFENVSDETLKRELAKGSIEAGLLLGNKAPLHDISHLPNLLYHRLRSMDDNEEGRIVKVNEGGANHNPLLRATVTGSLECVQMLVNYKANVNLYGTGAVNLAAVQSGQTDILSFLIAEGMTIRFLDLDRAVESNTHECLRILMKSFALNKLQRRKLLEKTATLGFVKSLRVLLEFIKEKKILRAAMKLAIENKKALCLKEFLKAGVKVEKKDSVVVDGLLKIAESLKETDELQNKDVITFFKAAQNGEIKKVVDFLERGMDVNIKDIRGLTCVYFSAMWSQDVVTKLLLQMKGILDFPADRNPLAFPAQHGHPRTLELLLSEGVNPNATYNGILPLDVAIRYNQWECVEILKSYKAESSLEMELDGIHIQLTLSPTKRRQMLF